MNVYWVLASTPERTLIPEREKVFKDTATLFVDAVISVRDKLGTMVHVFEYK